MPRSTRAKRKWEVRREIAEPRASFEELELRTSDGAALRALVDDPPGGEPIRGTLVLAHAMFAQKSSFGLRSSPGLSSAFVSRGFRTIAFDFRGHGDSTATGAWSYDDLVRGDLPAVVEYARAKEEEEKPVVVVGHALGGQVALAAQGTGRMKVDALVVLATNVWLREVEPSALRWSAKMALARVAGGIGELARRVPSVDRPLERVGLGGEERRRALAMFGDVADGRWQSADAQDDYLAALAHVRVPVAAVVGERDRLACHPSAGAAFVRRCAGAVEVFRAPTGHRDMVTSPLAWPAIFDAVEWAFAQARP